MMKSDSYYRRKELFETQEIPTQSEIICQHEKPLSDVLFDIFPAIIQKDLGVAPPLQGAGCDLWVSPSDLLIPIVRLKPPLTSKHVQALTHEGILGIGREIEQKLIEAKNRETDMALQQLQTKLDRLYEQEIQIAKIMERQICEMEFEEQVAIMKAGFQIEMTKALKQLEEHMLEQQEIRIEYERLYVQRIMAIKLEEALKNQAIQLKTQFSKVLKDQCEEFQKYLKKQLNAQYEKFLAELAKEKNDKLYRLKLLRHHIECKNIANLMYVLCAERARCSQEVFQIHQDYKLLIFDLEEDVSKKKTEIEELIATNLFKDRKLVAWEERCQEIIKQFQKFINFSLKAVPSQAEFLLNVRKLMTLHISEIPEANTSPDFHSQCSEISCEHQTDIDGYIPRMPSDLNENIHGDNIMKYGITTPDTPSVQATDSHKTLDTEYDLRCFMFNKQTYVREDVRNQQALLMQSVIENDIWKTGEIDGVKSDVVSQKSLDPENISKSSVRFNYNERHNTRLSFRCLSPMSLLSKNSINSTSGGILKRPSFVPDNVSLKLDTISEKIKHESKLLGPRNSLEMPNLKVLESLKQKTKDSDTSLKKKRLSRLLSVRDSVTLQKERLMSKDTIENFYFGKKEQNDKPDTDPSQELDEIGVDNNKKLSLSKDSLEFHKVRLSKDQTQLVQFVKKYSKRESKLLTARDSLIMHRQSIKNSILPTYNGRRESGENSFQCLLRSQLTENKQRQSSRENFSIGSQKNSHVCIVEDIKLNRDSSASLSMLGSFTSIDPLLKITHNTNTDTTVQSDSIDEKEKNEVEILPTVTTIPVSTEARSVQAVVGETKGTEHLDTTEDFISKRIDSLLTILKQNNSLLKLFTLQK